MNIRPDLSYIPIICALITKNTTIFLIWYTVQIVVKFELDLKDSSIRLSGWRNVKTIINSNLRSSKQLWSIKLNEQWWQEVSYDFSTCYWTKQAAVSLTLQWMRQQRPPSRIKRLLSSAQAKRSTTENGNDMLDDDKTAQKCRQNVRQHISSCLASLMTRYLN